jgi:glycosyltransferase involved in cell wall biosynthesis
MFFAPCAVDNDFWQKQANQLKAQKFQLKEKLGLAPDLPVILFVGKLIPLKRIVDLLKAFKKLSSRLKAHLVLVGEGSEKRFLNYYVEQENIKRVYFAGFKNQSELPVYYSVADVFVLPSFRDRSPKAVNEAMNFGLPIILSHKVGTANDLVKDKVNGFVYPMGDAEALFRCLLTLLRRPDLMTEMGKKSLEAVSGWSFEENIRAVLKAIKYALNPSY